MGVRATMEHMEKQINNLKDFYRGKKVLITGHTGFKGAWIAQVLTHWGADVVGVALPPHVNPNLYSVLALETRMRSHIADIRNFSELRKIFEEEKPEIVFHLAAQAIVRESYRDPLGTISVNTLGTAHVLQAIRETPFVKSAVLITTDKVYENKEWPYAYRENDMLGGHDPYSASKSSADIIIASFARSFFPVHEFGKSHRVLIAAARAGNVIGGGDWSPDRLIPDLMRSVFEKKEALGLRNPNSIRPWEFVLEPVSGYLLLGRKLYEGDAHATGAWNFGPEDASFVTAEHMIRQGIEIMGRGAYHVAPDDFGHESTLLKLDIAKAKSILKWKPILSLKENLAFTLDWYGVYYGNKENMVRVTSNQIDTFFGRFEAEA